MVENNFFQEPMILVFQNPDETLNIWEAKVLADVVWAIRKFQPDVIIKIRSSFSGTTHGIIQLRPY
jgi:hypothetical protein